MNEPGIITAITARAVLADLRHRGFAVVVRGDMVSVTPGPEPLTDADRQAIRACKAELLAALTAPPIVAAPPQHPRPVYLPCSCPTAVCWPCCNRPCERCGKPTGSAFIRRCVSCGELPDGA